MRALSDRRRHAAAGARDRGRADLRDAVDPDGRRRPHARRDPAAGDARAGPDHPHVLAVQRRSARARCRTWPTTRSASATCRAATRAPSPTCSARATPPAAGTTADRKRRSPASTSSNALAELPWSNGKVAMIGGSYDGTTANMVASARRRRRAGRDRPGGRDQPLVRLRLQRRRALPRQLPSTRPTRASTRRWRSTSASAARRRRRSRRSSSTRSPTGSTPCDSAEHTARGYDTSPDYDDFWDERDYRRDYDVPALIVHGWQDFNVRQSEGIDLYAAQDGSPFTQALPVPGRARDAERGELPAAAGRGSSSARSRGSRTGSRIAAAGAHRGHRRGLPRARRAGRRPGRATRTIDAAGRRMDRDRHEHRGDRRATSTSPSRSRATCGSRVRRCCSATVSVDADHGHLTPTLVDIAPDGTATPITRGFLNLRYRNGLARERAGAGQHADQATTVTFSPQDTIVPAGHRLGLILAGSNAVWAVPDQPAGQTFRLETGSRLELPAAP